jgi:mono/diheme cytochrome c family protein
MFDVVHDGRGAMPRFGTSLSDEQITAIVRYLREVL